MNSPQSPASSHASHLPSRPARTSLWLKLLTLGGLLLVANTPSCFIQSVVHERRTYEAEAQQSVVAGWADRHQIQSLQFVIPFQYPQTEETEKGQRIVWHEDQRLLNPELIEITWSDDIEIRERGIFKIPIYKANMKMQGEFRLPRDVQPRKSNEVLIAGGQKLVWDLPTSSSIHEFSFKLNGKPARLNRTEKGFEAPLEDLALGEAVSFELDLKLNGFAGVDFRIPAEKLKLSMASKWPHPSFGGQLPITQNITGDGFTATWSLMQSQNNQSISIGHVSPVNIYSQTERALKYSSLIILLLLTSLFLMETLWTLRLHGLHYLLMTLPLSAFYILLLALSEHLGFAMSYVAGCTAVLALLLIYFRGIGAKARQTSVLALILIAIDALVYTMLSSEDFALLIGAISLFLALSAFMLMTMRVNWTRAFSATPTMTETDSQTITGTASASPSASLRSDV